jgi:hypothetical protein
MAETEKLNPELPYWRLQLSFPDWYVRLENYLRTEIFPIVHDDPELKARRHVFYDLVSDMLKKGRIPLAKGGPDLDAERQPIQAIIIHHTEEDPDISLDKLSAIAFIRQYAKAYLDDDLYGHKGVRGEPIWSGHFRNGRQVFFAYHWLIRPDGKAERLLEDSQMARHAVQMNPTTIGIALSGNYEHSTPPLTQIEAAAKVIRENYSFVDIGNILGHCEVMSGRTCPGDKFLPEWKKVLIEAVRR